MTPPPTPTQAADDPAPPTPAAPPPVGQEVMAGAGLGLLVGVLLGLSVADLVGKIVAALIGMIGAFLGLSGSVIGTAQGPDRAIRTGAFGAACTLGLLAGLVIRAEGLFSPSISQDVADWTRAGATTAQAVDFVGYARLGIRPAGRETGDLPKPGVSSSVLFSGANAVCNEIEGMSAANQLATLRSKPSPLPELAAAAAVSADPARFIATNLRCGQ